MVHNRDIIKTHDLPFIVTSSQNYNSYYSVSVKNMQQLQADVSPASTVSLETLLNLMTNVKNYIGSIRVYPFDTSRFAPDPSEDVFVQYVATNIQYGNVASSVTPRFISKSVGPAITYILSPGSPGSTAQLNYKPFGNFLDYEPYTKYSLFIPFIGTVDITSRDLISYDSQTGEYNFKTITVKYYVDYSTGDATVYAETQGTDGKILYTGTCKIGYDISLGSDDSALIDLDRYIAAMKTGFSLGFGGAGISSSLKDKMNQPDVHTVYKTNYSKKDPNKITSVTRDTYYGETKQTKPAPDIPNSLLNILGNTSQAYQVSAGDGVSSYFGCTEPFIVRQCPSLVNLENYAKYQGHAVCEDVRIGAHAGYCEISMIHMEGFKGILKEELDAIEECLRDGVILPEEQVIIDLSGLSGCYPSSTETKTAKGSSYEIVIKPNAATPVPVSHSATMGGTAVPESCWTVDNNIYTLNIPNVTGALVIDVLYTHL